MRSDHPKPSETGRVILFRPRQAGSRWPSKARPAQGAVGLGNPQSAREDDDPRHRRFIHALGLAYCLILAVAGVWLANEFTEMKRIEDCVLSGRSGCIPINVAARSD
jgi:hypothetical protein